MTLPTFISVINFAASKTEAVGGRDVTSLIINAFKDITLPPFTILFLIQTLSGKGTTVK
jgi:hypothetical protein